MDETLAAKLIGSAVEHVPIVLETKCIMNALTETRESLMHTPLECTPAYQEINAEHYGRFYPILLIRNDIIGHEFIDWLDFFKKKPSDYISRIQRDASIVDIIQSSVMRNRSHKYSLLGMYERVYFLYNSFSKFERSVHNPQLIVPGYENDKTIRKWEKSLSTVHYNIIITRHPHDLFKDS